MSYPFIIQGNNVVVVISNVPHSITNSHPYYEQIREWIKLGDWESVRKYIDVSSVVSSFSKEIEVKGGVVYYGGSPLHNYMTSKLLQLMKEGFDSKPFVFFMKNLMKNPSKKSIDELYKFLEAGNMPITPDGHFLAYKKVRKDYKDCHTGTISNAVGEVVSMDRKLVNDKSEETCSHGLHFCSYDYLSKFSGERIMILKINPEDVVSIPADYNDTKGRCCRYVVVGEVDIDKAENAFDGPVGSWGDYEFDDSFVEEGWVQDYFEGDEVEEKVVSKQATNSNPAAKPRLRDSKGRFIKAKTPSSRKRDSLGRFV
jgi:hypothetical protein